MPQSSLCRARRLPGMTMKENRFRRRFRNRHPASVLGPGSGSSPASPFYFAGGAAAAAALAYFATMRLTRGTAASVCFLAIGRSFS